MTLGIATSFRAAKRRVLEALRTGRYQIETRRAIDEKNALSTGAISADALASIVARCNGTDHEQRPHHAVADVHVHILKKEGWYIKFYIVEPDLVFISVHR